MVLDSSQIIRIYTTRLVNSLIPSEFGEEYIHSLTSELLNQFSNPDNGTHDINKVLNQYKRLFLTTGKNTEWIKFHSIVESLLNVKSPDKVGRYLVFLASIKGLNINEGSSSQSQSRPHNFKNLSPPPFPPSGIPPNKPINLQSSPYNYQHNAQSQPQVSLEFNMGNYGNAPMAELTNQFNNSIAEETILQYLSFTLTGLDSKIFQFIKRGDEITVEIPSNLDISHSLLIGKILEPGLIYVKLKHFLTQKIIEDSPIKTSFVTVLNNELNEYSNFINELFNLNPQSLTIVYRQLYDMILKLRLLYSLTNQLTLSGYEFLTKLFELTKFEDRIISENCRTIFHQISKPYYEIIENWIVKGDLIDNSKEFFIEFDVNQQEFHDIIKYLPEKVPKFFVHINEDIGFKIFQIGKILIFLNKYCKELKWVNDYNNKYSDFIYVQNSGLQLMDINVINELINTQYEELLSFFTFVIHGKYEVLNHFKNYKKFLLMSSNDFIELIIFNGFELFNEPSNQLTSNQLSKVLVDSINSSSIKNYSMETKNRLDARILDLSHGNIGWQVFTLEYRINDLPITNIMNFNNSNLEYLKFFNFIWKLKQFQYLLNLSFKESNKIKKDELKKFSKSKSFSHNKYILQSFKTINLIRFKLIKFLNLIINYLSNEIELNFNNLLNFFYKESEELNNKLNKDFKKLIDKSHHNVPPPSMIKTNIRKLNFNEVINVNLNYIKNLKFKILDNEVIGKSGQSLIDQIYNILKIIFKFIKTNEEFNSIIIQYVSLLNVEDNDTNFDQIDNDFEYWEGSLRKIVDKIYKEIYFEFSTNYNDFVKDLRSDIDLKDFAKLF